MTPLRGWTCWISGVTLDDGLVDVMVAEAEWAIGQGISPEYDGDLRALFRSAVYEDALQKLAPERGEPVGLISGGSEGRA